MIGNGQIGAQTVAAATALPANSGVIGGDPVSGTGSSSSSGSGSSSSSSSNKSGAATLAVSSLAVVFGLVAALAAC